MSKSEILLSVIIPCKNEEKNIERCLRSVLSEVKNISSFEILLVDSRSTDRSIEKAKQFPVDIIQLRDNWFSSPASARYLGCLNTTGKYIFVIDADMELIPGFLEKAIEFLDANEQTAGVAGMGAEYYDDGSVREDMYKRGNRFAQVFLLAGAAMFKRQALLASGGYFNPFLKAEEEQEICIRLLKAGFKLFSLPYPMIKHYTSLNIDNFRRRLNAGMYRGIGQMFRLTLVQGNFSFAYFTRFKLFYVFIALITVFCCAIFALARNTDNSLLLLWSGIIVLIWLFSCYIKRGVKEGTNSMYKCILINTHILQGLFDHTPKISEYPQEVIVIKKGKEKI
ncbi:MAG: glycosyltransferase family A protein [Candidatus Omnitrophota bacterium]